MSRKRMMGASMPDVLWKAIEDWLADKPEKNQTVFLKEAIIEKLEREGIRVNKAEAPRDMRARRNIQYLLDERNKAARMNDKK